MDYCTCMNVPERFRWVPLTAWLAVFAVLLIGVGYWVDRRFYGHLIGSFTALFGVYLVVVRFESLLLGGMTWKQVLGLGLLLRLVMVVGTPNLSDDWYRFLWDGMLVDLGIHPFLYTPREAVALFSLPSYHIDLFGGLNSPDYHTVYPPLSQVFFWLSIWLGGGDWKAALLVLKLMVWAGEAFTMVALGLFLREVHGGWERKGLVWYAFNPLVILETVGNVHFEGMMAVFLVMCCWALQVGRVRLAAFLWASAVSVKLLPLLLLPGILAWLGKKRGLLFAGVGAVSLLVYFFPLVRVSVLQHMMFSVGLYFGQFEFNACFYYIGSYGARLLTGWHEGRLVSPLLAATTLSIGLCFSILIYRRGNFGMAQLQSSFLILWTVYLLNSAAVHPWYILLPFTLSLGTGLMYPFVWTWLVYFSYSHYEGGVYKEHFEWIVFEYCTLLMVLWKDIWKYRQRVAYD